MNDTTSYIVAVVGAALALLTIFLIKKIGDIMDELEQYNV